jgi:hypothetical protein
MESRTCEENFTPFHVTPRVEVEKNGLCVIYPGADDNLDLVPVRAVSDLVPFKCPRVCI